MSRTTPHHTPAHPHRRTRIGSFRLSLIAGVLVLGAAACGSDDDSSSGTVAPEETSAPIDTAAGDVTTTVATGTDDTTADTTADSMAEPPSDTSAGAPSDDPFCVAAQEADEAGDSIDFENMTPETLEAQMTEALEAGRAALAIAPPEIADTAGEIVGFQEQIAQLLEQHEWNFIAMATSPEGQALVSDPDLQQAGADLDEYLQTECGIVAD